MGGLATAEEEGVAGSAAAERARAADCQSKKALSVVSIPFFWCTDQIGPEQLKPAGVGLDLRSWWCGASRCRCCGDEKHEQNRPRGETTRQLGSSAHGCCAWCARIGGLGPAPSVVVSFFFFLVFGRRFGLRAGSKK